MSASSKKKLRSEQASEKLTERQLTEKKQAKEVKAYTIAFAAIMAIVLVVAIVVGVQKGISASGVREKNTVAYTVGSHELSNADLSYFFIDSINNFSTQYGPYASFMGIDLTKPLDEQYMDDAQTTTWADDFMNTAKDSAKSVYAIVDAAEAAGHTLTEEETAQVDLAMTNVESYAQLSGAGSVKNYLKAVYGPGASESSYREYLEASILADSYRAAYADSLKFEDADLREAEKENYNAYSSFSFYTYYVDASRFLEGGTEDEEGNVTYSQAEKDAAAKAAEAAAKVLVEATNTDELNMAIADMEINKDQTAKATFHDNMLYGEMAANYAEDAIKWISDTSRKAGEISMYPNDTESLDEDGNSVTTTNGYVIVMYESVNENTDPLPNARHILVSFEGGTTDENGVTTYSDEEKAAAKEQAEAILKEFQDGEATEEAFAALATEKTTDEGSKANGGLYENILPGQMVPAFNDWCFDSSRKAGDTGIVETEYGYHVMYFSGSSDLSYRDLQLTTELTNKALEEWFADIVDNASSEDGDLSLIRTDITLQR